jgi:uncharacterized protein (TIGR02231 family)
MTQATGADVTRAGSADARVEPSGLPSRAVRVTLFEDRAEVVRTARAVVTAGAAWVAIAGVSPFVDDRSVQARAVGEAARVLSARVLWRAHREAALGREAIDALEAEARRAQKLAETAGRALERAERAEARATELVKKWAAAVSVVPRGASKPAILEAWRSSLEAIDRDVRAAWSAAAEARSAELRAHDEVDRAEARLREGSIEKPRYEALIEVQVEAEAQGEVELEITYRVPCALWRPEHLARLVSTGDDGASCAIEIVTWATAWQRTGELWEDVLVRFSTARPARSATPPLVEDDVLVARKKTDQERRNVRVEARDQAIVLAGLDRGARSLEEMPGVEDGGEPLTFEPAGPVSLVSNGRPLRVEVARRSLTAKLERVLFPELAVAAHLRATATLSQGGPLLAGPVRVARGQSLVGRSKLGYVGGGEPFELGFGADDGVRVRRTQDEERDTAAVLGTQKLRRTVKVYLSNLSGDVRRVLVTERIPVSEIDDVDVTLLDAPGWSFDTKDGFARMETILAPRSTQVLKLVYEIRASSKVVMPF